MFQDFPKAQRHGLGSEIAVDLFQRVHWGQVQGKITVFVVDLSVAHLRKIGETFRFLDLRAIAVGIGGAGYGNLFDLLRRNLTGRDTVGVGHLGLLMSEGAMLSERT
jgi:hypothetical protein